MHKIAFGKITKDFPESIAEMSGPQFRYFAFLEMNRQLGKMTMADLEVMFIYFALDMVRTSNSPKVVENINRLRPLVHPYFSNQEHKGKKSAIVNLDFVNNSLQEISIGETTLYGPEDALQDCTYEEVFVHGQNAMIDFCNTNSIACLDNLVAVLYRPKVNGKRPDFRREKYEEHLELVKQLQPEVKFAIFLFFSSCHKFITTCSALDIGGGNTLNIAQLFQPSKKKAKGIGPLGIIYSLAESRVFGDADKTGRKNVYEVLARLVQLHEQAKEAEKNAKRKKT